MSEFGEFITLPRAEYEQLQTMDIKARGMQADIRNLHRVIEGLKLELAGAEDLRVALDESIKLQSHYAKLLNIYDGGLRLQFASAAEWIARLNSLKEH